jgi:NADH-quinone oxidoreductase subunit G
MSAKMEQAVEQAVEMVNIEVNGIPLKAPKGSMIIEATDKAGIEIPRFCYHPKLSIAANCRMCLVDVEKMPKPMPACATPVMEGMKVYTESRRATDAQHGVMEFLLINHPLDCPICDQGGECELQDQAMGYGRSVSRFSERKRVVRDKNVGPLVQTEMTRCIHCTRCVRFLEEIAGTSEMGGAGRGDRVEIGTCVQNSINSELSGNIIDICPVGALTNKPFRFAARAWELVARPSVAVHDGVGSSLFHHVRRGRVLRSVPRDNESTNESWMSDRDRFSHIGLYTEDRVTAPQVKENGEWKIVSWNEAAETVARILSQNIETNGPEQFGALMSPSAASEEFFLAQRLVRRLGSGNIDHRLREQDFSDDLPGSAPAPFEKKIAAVENSDVVLLVGSNPREEAPLVGHRIRKAWRNGARISSINPLDWEFTFETSLDAIVAPQRMVGELAALAAAVEKTTGNPAPAYLRVILDGAKSTESHNALATRLQEAKNGLVLLGQSGMSHPDAAWLRSLSAYIAAATGAAFNRLPHGGNAAGGRLAGAVPHHGPGGCEALAGMNAAEMLASPRQCYLLWGIEPEYDIDNPARAMSALRQAGSVISVVSHASETLREISDVILPLAPQPESEGSMVNFDGSVMSYKAAGTAPGETRPGWKILRRIGAEMGLEGFDQINVEDVLSDLLTERDKTDPVSGEPSLTAPGYENSLYRTGELPMYSIDMLCRRSEPLQQTQQASSAFVGLNPEDAARLGLEHGVMARVSQGGSQAELEVRVSSRVPPGGVWLRSATPATREFGPAVAPVSVEVA